MPAKVYTQKEAKVTPIKKKTLAVIGYGSQGHAHALNLKESGCKVIIGLYKGSKSIRVAKRHGFEVMEVAEAVKQAEVIMIGVPDMKQAEVYENEIKPNLSKGKTLLFTHGFAIHFGLIKAPRGVSVIMVAPKGPGHVVRSQYKEGKGVPALIAVNKGSAKDAKKIALAWAAGVGAARSGILETSFKEETETDLFGEQAVLCGGASALVEAGFETLVEAGYAPEMAYFECLHELKLIVDLMIESGIAGMRFSVSETAKYGDVTRGPRVINGNVKKSMKSILKEIQSGKFAKEWVKEYQAGLPKYNKLLEDGEKHPIEETGQRLRSLMPWIPKKNIKGAQASYS
ncbi:MAG: ketol-acid reductoisomerase [Opitutae bacterium]|jgi:ketol-acid reductoisomerase|nr:ketol-acid reductoisomerase [Opitutae bacterium]|tara:strand:- start:2095 stop:3123 length:1029 start_codon:yes stop_codon:yes gene_type:complete